MFDDVVGQRVADDRVGTRDAYHQSCRFPPLSRWSEFSQYGPSYWELINMNMAQTPYYCAKWHPRDECVCASAPHRGTLFRWCTHECNVDVLNVGVLAPQQLVPPRRRINAVRDMIVQLRTWPALFFLYKVFFPTVSKSLFSADSKSDCSQTQKVERLSKNR